MIPVTGTPNTNERACSEERFALLPFLSTLNTSQPSAFPIQAPQQFLEWLIAHGLAPAWSEWLERAGTSTPLPADFAAKLKHERQKAAALYLLQRATTGRVTTALSDAGIPCAVFKGIAIRELLYPSPWDRPAADIDILIHPGQRESAIRALCAQGLGFKGDPTTVSHEAALLDKHTVVDLHWSLLRPGRSRLDLTPKLLETTRLTRGLPLLNDDANLLIMLVHPAFTKHINGRQSRLIRAVDLDLHLRTTQPDWSWLLSLIDSAGLKVAAWAVLYWVRSLLDTPVDPWILQRLAPSAAQRKYLSYWIDHRLPARLAGVPGLVQGAFTLALYEHSRDAVRALIALAHCHLSAGEELRRLQQIVADSSPDTN